MEQTVDSGDKAAKPADPAAEGYTFAGWYKDAAFTEKFDFDAEINADTEVYAKWTKNEVVPPAPQTGDDSLMFVVLLAVSAIALAGTAFVGKGKKKEN